LLTDQHGRTIDYLRLAVTDRCNLRCFYCMPEEGLQWLQRSELMSYEEMLRLCRVLITMGIKKIRITGGEPFVRKDILFFLTELSKITGLKELTITTNGVLTAPFVPEFKKLGIQTVNLSLDTLDRDRFFAITHRDELPNVLHTLDELLRYNIKVKINAVVMEGKNTADILPLTELCKDLPVCIRFIEEMPFNGSGNSFSGLTWNYKKILEVIRDKFPGIQKQDVLPHATSTNYQIPGYKGTVGIIAAYTRSFCGSCNRIRITPAGMLKTCLYGEGKLNCKDVMRNGCSDDELQSVLSATISKKEKDGLEAEQQIKPANSIYESMSMIGG
jgi:GTP 3',8-cyclase